MKHTPNWRSSAVFFLLLLPLLSAAPLPEWGFFAHRRINRLAVLTLPPDMMVFFKPNIDWIADHAVDADMRRYATAFEAPRHFIDLDNYGTPPFEHLPRTWGEALLTHTTLWAVRTAGDTTALVTSMPDSCRMQYREWFYRHVLPAFYRGETTLNLDSLPRFLPHPDVKSVFFRETLTQHGILPWHLQRVQRQLTEAFRRGDAKRILRHSADLGHYLGDAHVPLHTTSNYNGQKTGQHGIHGFWESRIPELFADAEYDYFVGKPEYIERTDLFFWNVIFQSHSMVDSVLLFEKQLRQDFPSDRQLCPELRNGRLMIAPCREFAAAYQQALDRMVERRMRAAIRAVAGAWYTAWVDAGQPDLSKLVQPTTDEEERREEETLRKAYEQGKMLGREEEHD